jgi:hypothetical protein
MVSLADTLRPITKYERKEWDQVIEFLLVVVDTVHE